MTTTSKLVALSLSSRTDMDNVAGVESVQDVPNVSIIILVKRSRIIGISIVLLAGG